MKNIGWILLLTSQLAFAQVYKWTDSEGNVHFSDKPHPGAQEIQVPTVQTFSSQPVPENNPPPEQQPKNTENEETYTKLRIVQPEDQITIRNPQGAITIVVEPIPKLKPQDKIQLILDDMAVGNPQSNGVFSLEGINRGSHTISAEIVSAEGKTLMTSNHIMIFMQQPRVGMGSHSP